jgi:hypothetical protein
MSSTNDKQQLKMYLDSSIYDKRTQDFYKKTEDYRNFKVHLLNNYMRDLDRDEDIKLLKDSFIENFVGYIFLKFDNEKHWVELYGKIIDSCLYVYEDIHDNEWKVMFNLYLCEIKLVQPKHGDLQDFYYYLELKHYFDRDKLQLTL